MTGKEISRLIYKWIGVDGGYLGSFTYANHDRFWLETCDLVVDTRAFPGTTRECFETTLMNASARDQAAVLRAILEEYPPAATPNAARPNFRSETFHREILAWIGRLEIGTAPVEVGLLTASETVRRALEDADNLMRTSGPQSAVDRVHTAMHGYLLSLCAGASIPHVDRMSPLWWWGLGVGGPP